jgi:uncharacterized membrane protein YdbT with pleckstrin-like domain
MDNSQTEFHQSSKVLVGGWVALILFGWALIGIFIFIAVYLKYKNMRVVLGKHSVMLTTGVLTKSTTEIPYPKINSVSLTQRRGRNYGTVIISTGNDLTGLRLDMIQHADILSEGLQARIGQGASSQAVTQSIAQGHTPTRVEALEKLAALKAKGVITAAEFQAEKHRILNS